MRAIINWTVQNRPPFLFYFSHYLTGPDDAPINWQTTCERKNSKQNFSGRVRVLDARRFRNNFTMYFCSSPVQYRTVCFHVFSHLLHSSFFFVLRTVLRIEQHTIKQHENALHACVLLRRAWISWPNHTYGGWFLAVAVTPCTTTIYLRAHWFVLPTPPPKYPNYANTLHCCPVQQIVLYCRGLIPSTLLRCYGSRALSLSPLAANKMLKICVLAVPCLAYAGKRDFKTCAPFCEYRRNAHSFMPDMPDMGCALMLV